MTTVVKIHDVLEYAKNLNQVNSIINRLLSLNFNRSDVVIGFGGGIIGDMTGFLCSIYKRGIKYQMNFKIKQNFNFAFLSFLSF